jgi:hypothetical protein
VDRPAFLVQHQVAAAQRPGAAAQHRAAATQRRPVHVIADRNAGNRLGRSVHQCVGAGLGLAASLASPLPVVPPTTLVVSGLNRTS